MHSDVAKTPLKTSSIDTVFATGLFHELPSLNALKEFYRVLVKRGYLIVVDRVSYSVPRKLLWFKRLFKAYILHRNPETPYTVNEVASSITSYGFDIVYMDIVKGYGRDTVYILASKR